MLHALVVEDYADVRDVMASALTMSGDFRVTQAADGSAALDLLEREKPDVAIIDIGIPDRTGVEIAEQARLRGVPTLLVTGQILSDAQLEAFGFPWMRKPFHLNDLIARASAVIEQAKMLIALSEALNSQAQATVERSRTLSEALREEMARGAIVTGKQSDK